MLNKNPKKVPRVRIAPSPTGPLHIGTARTALFNFLFAKSQKGVFILRIEDTDIERSDPKWEKDIMENLLWLGIEWDEGPILENKKYKGNYGPYRQSERLESYAKYLEKLLKEGKAYFCFCSEEELEAQRQYQLSIGQPPKYSGKCRQLSEKEVKKLQAEGKPSIIRFKTPIKKIRFKDLIRGEIEFDSSLIGDFSLAKNLATPLYNFAVVVDDFEMKITHVIRGEDHIPNTPKQILIQEALGFYRPEYAHLPLILGPDKAKLSKRHGATAIGEYKKQGYLPEAMVNFMAFLGWNPGTEREIYSLASLIKEFSLEKVQKAGAIFNLKRLDFLNGFYIRQKSLDKLTELCLPYLIEKNLISKTNQKYQVVETGKLVDLSWIKKIIKIYQERLKKLSEISELCDFFFKEKIVYSPDLLKWKEMEKKEIIKALDWLKRVISEIDPENFNRENLEKILILEAENFAKELSKPVGDRGYLLWPLRVALTGKEASAGPFEVAEILGKENSLARIKAAKEFLK